MPSRPRPSGLSTRPSEVGCAQYNRREPGEFCRQSGTPRARGDAGGGTAAAQQWRFRQLYRQYFDTEACARAALGPYWQQATTEQRQEFINRYEDYVVITYSLPLGQIEAQSFTVLGSQSDQDGVIVMS